MQTTLTELLERPEGQRLDFKRAEIDPVKALRAVCAFANTSGGYLVLGVGDDRRVRGVPDIQGLEERYASLITDRIEPYLSVDLERVRFRGDDVLVIRVPRFPGAFRLLGKGGGVFVRQGSTTRSASPEKVRELEREAEVRSWDESPCAGATRDDLDEVKLVEAYAKVEREVGEAKLRTLKMLVEVDGRTLPSNAAIILFGYAASRERLLPAARFRCARFAGDTKAEILDQLDDRDLSVLDALGGNRERPGELGGVRAFIRRNTRNRARIGEVLRIDTPEYADGILREVLPNAVAHADYSQRTMPLRVSIYANRLDVENPGGWPVGFEVADFKAGVSRIRNPVVARVLHDLKYIEGWGSGYERIREVCAAQAYPEPDWHEQGPVLRVRLYPHPETVDEAIAIPTASPPAHGVEQPAVGAGADLNERQAWFIAQIASGARVSATVMAQHFNVTARTAERDIRQLRDRELVAYVGPAKTGRYIVVRE